MLLAALPIFPLCFRWLQETLRYGYFKQAVQRLIIKMSTCPKSVWGFLTARADWSPNELRLSRKVFVPPRKPGDAAPIKGGPLPAAWDWRRSALDKVTPAKEQGRCGSCFAFAAVGAVESKLLIQHNKSFSDYQIDLSEQAVVDCVNAGQGYMSTGCQGGFMDEALAWASRQGRGCAKRHWPCCSAHGCAGLRHWHAAEQGPAVELTHAVRCAA